MKYFINICLLTVVISVGAETVNEHIPFVAEAFVKIVGCKKECSAEAQKDLEAFLRTYPTFTKAVNSENKTPFEVAAEHDNKKLVDLFLSNISEEQDKIHNEFCKSAARGSATMAQRLLETNALDKRDVKTVLRVLQAKRGESWIEWFVAQILRRKTVVMFGDSGMIKILESHLNPSTDQQKEDAPLAA